MLLKLVSSAGYLHIPAIKETADVPVATGEQSLMSREAMLSAALSSCYIKDTCYKCVYNRCTFTNRMSRGT